MKKILALFAALVLLSSLFSLSASAATKENGFTYWVSFDDNGNYYSIISGIDKNKTGRVTVPSTLGGNPVVKIQSLSSGAFEELIVPDCVREIGNQALIFCGSLKKLHIGSGVKTIAHNNFETQNQLEEVTVSAGNTTFYSDNGVLINREAGEVVVYPCRKKGKSYTLPSGTKSVNYRAFFNVEELEELHLGDSLETIGLEGIKWCPNLKKITVGKSLKNIGNEVFTSCAALSTLTISESNPNVKAVNGIIYSKDMKKIFSCIARANVTDYRIPESVTEILPFAFYDNTTIKKLTVPGTLKKIPKQAFFRMEGVEEVVVESGITTVCEGAFGALSSCKKITLPDTVTTLETEAVFSCNALSEINLPNSITSIGERAVCYNKVSDLIVPSGLKSISAEAFIGCQINRIYLPKSVTSIKKAAFDNCNSVEIICYEGSEAEFKRISIGSDNDCFKDATVVYNAKGLPSTDNHEHVVTDWKLVKYPTITQPGTESGICSVCYLKISRDVEKGYVDQKTGVKFEAEEGTVPQATMISITPAERVGEAHDKNAIALKDVADNFVAYNIEISDRIGQTPTINGKIKVSFPIPEGFGTDVAIYYVSDGGVAERLESFLSQDRKTVWTEVTHFSTYAVAKLLPGVEKPTPEEDIISSDSVSGSKGDNGNSGKFPTVAVVIGAAVVCAAGVLLFIFKDKIFKK